METQTESPASKAILTRLDSDLADELRRRAAADDRTVSGWVRRVLTAELEKKDDR